MQVPPDDIFLPTGQLTFHSFRQLHPGVYAFVKGFMPVPVSIKGNFWGNYYIDSLPRFLKAILVVTFFVYPFMLLRKNIPALLFYCCAVFFMLLFICLLPLEPSPRYYGMIFIFFISAAWLAGNRSNNIFSIKTISDGNLKAKLFYGFFYCILVVNVLCGMYAYAITYSRPFTGAKQAAHYIKANQLDSQMVVVGGYWPGPALSSYLGKKVFYLNIDKEGSYLYWKMSYFKSISRPLSQQLSQPGYLTTKNHFVFVSDQPVHPYLVASGNHIFQFTPLDSFTRSVGMPYYIYSLDKKINPVPASETR